MRGIESPMGNIEIKAIFLTIKADFLKSDSQNSVWEKRYAGVEFLYHSTLFPIVEL